MSDDAPTPAQSSNDVPVPEAASSLPQAQAGGGHAPVNASVDVPPQTVTNASTLTAEARARYVEKHSLQTLDNSQAGTENAKKTDDVYQAGTESAENGANPDREKHLPTRIAGKNGGILTPFDSDRARQAVSNRWSRFARASARGLFAAVAAVNSDVSNAYDAYGYMVEVQAGIAVGAPGTASECIASTKAAEFVRKAIGADVGAPERASRGDAPAGGATLTLSLSGDVAQALAELIVKRASRTGE